MSDRTPEWGSFPPAVCLAPGLARRQVVQLIIVGYSSSQYFHLCLGPTFAETCGSFDKDFFDDSIVIPALVVK
eukprot:gene4143-4467_t